MRILGIDPGYAIVGTAMVDYDGNTFSLQSCGAITTSADMRFSDRLAVVFRDLSELIDQFKPDCMAVEELFFATNHKTAIFVAEARGVILLAAKLKNVPIYEYTPLQVKSAVTGYGKATKNQVQEMTRIMLNLRAVPKPDDVADAVAIAICHGNNSRGTARQPTEV